MKPEDNYFIMDTNHLFSDGAATTLAKEIAAIHNFKLNLDAFKNGVIEVTDGETIFGVKGFKEALSDPITKNGVVVISLKYIPDTEYTTDEENKIGSGEIFVYCYIDKEKLGGVFSIILRSTFLGISRWIQCLGTRHRITIPNFYREITSKYEDDIIAKIGDGLQTVHNALTPNYSNALCSMGEEMLINHIYSQIRTELRRLWLRLRDHKSVSKQTDQSTMNLKIAPWYTDVVCKIVKTVTGDKIDGVDNWWADFAETYKDCGLQDAITPVKFIGVSRSAPLDRTIFTHMLSNNCPKPLYTEHTEYRSSMPGQFSCIEHLARRTGIISYSKVDGSDEVIHYLLGKDGFYTKKDVL